MELKHHISKIQKKRKHDMLMMSVITPLKKTAFVV